MPSGARKGPFFCTSQEFLAATLYASLPPVILSLEDVDDLHGKGGERLLHESLVSENLIAARMGEQVCQLQARDVVYLGLHMELLTGQGLLESSRSHEVCAAFPQPEERILEPQILLAPP